MIAVAAPLALLGAAIAAWFVAAGARPAARVQLRFADVLFAALGAAFLIVPAAGSPVTLLVLPVASGVIALATAAGFARPLPPAIAAVLLSAVALAALAAAITGFSAAALVPAVLAMLAVGVLSAGRFDATRLSSLQGMLSALCLLGAASACALNAVGPALPLFAAAGLLGVTLALARSDAVVEEKPGPDLRRLAIGARPRA